MKKTIKIDKGQPLELDSSLGWLYCYQEQFGHDILPDLMPAIESLLTLSVDVLRNGTGAGDVLAALDGDTLSDAFLQLFGFETTTTLNVVWSLAKNADDSIGDPREFYGAYETFPIDRVFPVALQLIIESSVSSKNARSLLTTLNKMRTSISTRSRSQGSTEGLQSTRSDA